ncbi:MAG TPA: response regulator, partial [bacterium]|nr:response regulator [bacterium]
MTQDTSSNRKPKILVVDDEPAFKELICMWLRKRYDVIGADNAKQAMQELQANAFDLVLSDITMPGVNGYELVTEMRGLFPKMKVALITAWSIEECLKVALQQGIGNIIAKGLPLDFTELDLTVDRLLSEDIFGLERYLEYQTPVHKALVHSADEIIKVREEAFENLRIGDLPEQRQLALRLVVDEAIANAACHPRGDDLPRDGFVLPEEEAVEVHYARDLETIAFNVVDRFGNLNTQTILAYLERCINPTEDALTAERGRGLFLIRSLVDKMIINIKKGVRTEVIMLVHPRQRPRDQRPL